MTWMKAVWWLNALLCGAYGGRPATWDSWMDPTWWVCGFLALYITERVEA